MKPVIVGIIGNGHLINDTYLVQGTGRLNCEAVREVTGALPMIIPADPGLVSVTELMAVCDGFVFTGARPNVHPEEYGEVATPAHGEFDRNRDRLTLPLLRALVAAGQPLLAICRGFQELNVAFGGTLDPEIRDLPGRSNHRMPPEGTLEEKFALRHAVTFTQDGPFHRLTGAQKVLTNTLHGQGIREPGQRVVIDGTAPDGTAEAIYIADAPGFALGVQWHPEWNASADPVSRPLFAAFGQACSRWSAGQRPGSLKLA